MKKRFLCLECVFVFTLFWYLIRAQDAETGPAAGLGASENASAEGEVEEKREDIVEASDLVGSFDDKLEENVNSFQQVFVEATSQNAGIVNEITTGHPVVITLSDLATSELQQRAILPSQDETSENVQTKTSNVSETDETRSESPQTKPIEIQHQVNENLTEEIPSFSEWAQKQLEEAEKNREASNISTNNQPSNGKTKLRWKNYASLDCGAKIVASNPEAVSPGAILSPSKDEYKLNPCTSRVWFVAELCEAIQAKRIELANFELFSSSPREFVVSVSDRFPTRDWTSVGHFEAKDERDVQSFDLNPHLFGKYIKVEVKSHYGSEHYCPISLFRVFGTSEFEVLQKEDSSAPSEDDDDDDDTLDSASDSSKNLFSSATDAVISMVKKAAEVLGNKNHSNVTTEPTNHTKHAVPLMRVCTSRIHAVVCENCSDALFGRVYELLSCHDHQIYGLTRVLTIRAALTDTNICRRFGFEFEGALDRRDGYVEALFPPRIVAAMCNMIAVVQNKVKLNTSQIFGNETKNVTEVEDVVNIETSEGREPVAKVPEVTEPLGFNLSESVKSTCSTDTSQIKPTKTLAPDVEAKEGFTEASEVKSASESVREEVNQIESDVVEQDGENVEGLEDPLEGDIELNGEQNNIPATVSPQGKESVFLRLSNRIKALERNMSLSGQYLEELSKRYRKQVEEIQKLLDKTILGMNEESKKKDERNKQLEDRLLALTDKVESLIAEQKGWSQTIYCIIVSSLVTLFVVTFCVRVPDPIASKRAELKRKKSIDVVHPPPQKKKRRPSDQALKIVRSSTETNENLRRRKKKKQLLTRSNSIGAVNEGKASPWVRQSSAPTQATDWVEDKHIEEVPFVLEESEHSFLEPLSLPEANSNSPGFVKTASSQREGRMNGVRTTRKAISLDESRGITGEKRKGFRSIFRKVF